mmetsp:Transcript_29050/g.41610  ORF Transcript_29050/g.41610 Transcript_29050/m.41610 type:complete len:100 (-) Transcript_29050:583-882(-)
MDGNEKNLSSKRDGIDDTSSWKKAGVLVNNNNEKSKRALDLANLQATVNASSTNVSLASTMGKMMADAVQAGKKRVAEQTKAAAVTTSRQQAAQKAALV